MSHTSYKLTIVARIDTITAKVSEKVQEVFKKRDEKQTRLRQVELDLSGLRGKVCGIKLDVQEAVKKTKTTDRIIQNAQV